MKNANSQEFLDTLSIGMDKEFSFRGVTYFAQGWHEDDGSAFMCVDRDDSSDEGYFWSINAASMDECYTEFLKAPIFEGLTFWEAEKEMEWIYG